MGEFGALLHMVVGFPARVALAFALGLGHGVNPAMGWLFAVFLAMQRRDRREIFRSAPAIVLGHGLSDATAVLLVVVGAAVLPQRVLHLAAAGIILAYGAWLAFRYYRHHVRWATLNVTRGQLVLWSFLAAFTHGSGLLLMPLALGLPTVGQTLAIWLAHEAGTLTALVAAALLVHDRLGVGSLRRLWVNFDLPWVVTLLTVGGLSLLMAVAG